MITDYIKAYEDEQRRIAEARAKKKSDEELLEELREDLRQNIEDLKEKTTAIFEGDTLEDIEEFFSNRIERLSFMQALLNSIPGHKSADTKGINITDDTFKESYFVTDNKGHIEAWLISTEGFADMVGYSVRHIQRLEQDGYLVRAVTPKNLDQRKIFFNCIQNLDFYMDYLAYPADTEHRNFCKKEQKLYYEIYKEIKRTKHKKTTKA